MPGTRTNVHAGARRRVGDDAFMEGEPTELDLGLDPRAADDPDLPGPFTVGAWAKGFRDFLRKRPRVLVIGEVFNLKRARTSTYFELRDADGAAPCAIWNNDLERLKLPEGALKDGAEVVIGGGPDYYPGSQHRLAGLQLPRHLHPPRRRGRPARPARPLAPHARRRRPARPASAPSPAPRCRGRSASSPPATAPPAPTCSPGSSAAAGAGRSSGPTLRSRIAAPRGAIGVALRGLAEIPAVEVAVVCRGGGSLTDLWAFCDENLCRTVAHAAPAGGQRRRPRGRPHADRRRRRGLLLDPDPRRRGAGPGRRQPRPRRARARRDAHRAAPAARRSRRRAQRLAECSQAPHAHAARRARAACTRCCARSAPRPTRAHGRATRRSPPPTRWWSSARRDAFPRRRAPRRASASTRSRSRPRAPTIPSAPSPAATRSSPTARANRSARRAAAPASAAGRHPLRRRCCGRDDRP